MFGQYKWLSPNGVGLLDDWLLNENVLFSWLCYFTVKTLIN